MKNSRKYKKDANYRALLFLSFEFFAANSFWALLHRPQRLNDIEPGGANGG